VIQVEKKNNIKYKCDGCGCEVRRLKYLKKLNGGFFCKKCEQKRRKKHREFLKREICGIRKRSDMIKEAKEKREKQSILRKIVSALPKIKSIKSKGKKISGLGFHLTKDEKLFMYKNLVNRGLESDAASRRIKNLTEQMQELKERLRNEKLSEVEFNKRFKEGFAKLVEDGEWKDVGRLL